MPTESDTPWGQTLTAMDIKDRLIQEGDPLTLLMWPPNLFAFTSYILGLSGAYHLSVSPPKGYRWPPDDRALKDFVDMIDDESLRADALATIDRAGELQKIMKRVDAKRREGIWALLVRESGQHWRQTLDMDEGKFKAYADDILHSRLREELIPRFLLACWTAFDKLCMRASDRDRSWDIAHLLCNAAPSTTNPQDANNSMAPECDTFPSIRERWLAGIALLSMHAIADESCVGWGMQDDDAVAALHFASPEQLKAIHAQFPIGDDEKEQLRIAELFESREPYAKTAAQSWAERNRLDVFGTLATINPYRARVLPKRHTPDVGITLRSLSSNLAFHRSAIDVVWNRGRAPRALCASATTFLASRMKSSDVEKEAHLSILLLPFPLEVKGSYFSESIENSPVDPLAGYKFFKYLQRQEIITRIRDTIEAAHKESDIDIVVLPELALTELSRRQLEDCLQELDSKISFYVAGVSLNTDGREAFPQNNAVFFKSLYRLDEVDSWGCHSRFQEDAELEQKEGGAAMPYYQFKHHRWQLSKTQIQQYGLTSHLDEGFKYWEAINVRQRRVSFINLGERLTICPLICEDLARQDPIADLIRHVGPSLVIAILMDGPQLKDRWPARYAGILSEDPGSAVLTLTSLGMVRRWNTPYRSLSNSIALWSDDNGPRELELAPDASGLLLSVRVTHRREPVADGRLEIHPTSRLELRDVVQVRAPISRA